MSSVVPQRWVSRICVVASLIIPLIVGLAATVAIRLRLEASYDGNLDAGDRLFLLGAMVLLPATCYALSALVAFGAHCARPLSAPGLVVCAVVGSALSVGLWAFFSRVG